MYYTNGKQGDDPAKVILLDEPGTDKLIGKLYGKLLKMGCPTICTTSWSHTEPPFPLMHYLAMVGPCRHLTCCLWPEDGSGKPLEALGEAYSGGYRLLSQELVLALGTRQIKGNGLRQVSPFNPFIFLTQLYHSEVTAKVWNEALGLEGDDAVSRGDGMGINAGVMVFPKVQFDSWKDIFELAGINLARPLIKDRSNEELAAFLDEQAVDMAACFNVKEGLGIGLCYFCWITSIYREAIAQGLRDFAYFQSMMGNNVDPTLDRRIPTFLF